MPGSAPPSMPRLRAVFLDAGNTLLGLDYAFIAERLAAGGHAVTVEALRDAEQRARVRLDPHLAIGRSTEAKDVFVLYLGYTLDGLSLSWPGGAQALVQELRAARGPGGLWTVGMPGTAEALDGLRRRGLALAVVSNSNGTVRDALGAVGLLDRLDVVIDSHLVGVEKPDPRIFHHAARALGVEPAEAVHVGDLYSVDVAGARAAGCRAILLDPRGAWGRVDCPTAPDLSIAARLIGEMADGASDVSGAAAGERPSPR